MNKAVGVFTTIILIAIVAIGFFFGRQLFNASGREVEDVSSNLVSANTVTWPRAVEMIKNCEITSVSQSHSLNVILTTREQRTFRATEPAIDEVFKVANQAKSKCGEIMFVTE
jgi:hypothetical protein